MYVYSLHDKLLSLFLSPTAREKLLCATCNLHTSLEVESRSRCTETEREVDDHFTSRTVKYNNEKKK